MSKKIKISKEKLKDLYINQYLTTYEISKKFGCCQATIWKRLHEFKIKPRKANCRYANVPSKRFLQEHYIKKRLSTWKIEKKFGYSRGTTHRKLKEYDLKTRTLAESNIKKPRKPFSGNLVKKAYLIGFRLGDLRVRKQYKNSETISVACGSTIKEQILLIEKLFSPYCNVWKKSKNEKTNVEAHLDLSFSFLLSKELPKWVLNNKSCFFSFVAGFTDAEGWIGISNNMAVYSLGNYNKTYLNFIKFGLNKYGIDFKNKLTCGKTKGKTDRNGYTKNENYYGLRTSRKKLVFEILKETGHYLKHENKLKDLKRAIDNIKERNKKFGNINM